MNESQKNTPGAAKQPGAHEGTSYDSSLVWIVMWVVYGLIGRLKGWL